MDPVLSTDVGSADAHLFLPWVGETYESTGFRGLRLLIVGESHYSPVPEDQYPAFTQDVIRNNCFERRFAFFTTVAKLALGMGAGDYLSDVDRKAFWNSVAFYNYVQSLTGPGPKYRPTKAMWTRASEMFPNVLSALKPDMLLVIGNELDSWLKTPAGITRYAIQHPSSYGWKYSDWQSGFQTALQSAVENGAL